MIGKIVVALIIFVVLAVGVSWLASDSSRSFLESGSDFSFFNFAELSGTSTDTRLPAFPIPAFPTGPQIEGFDPDGTPNTSIFAAPSGGELNGNEQDVRTELLDIEAEYDRLREQVGDARVFGDPSPHREDVYFSNTFVGGALADDPRMEYVTLSSDLNNTAPINISGWSIQSVITGRHFIIPRGVRTLKMGEIGALEDVYLAPGREATITTGVSPVGVSFRENTCSGYLDQFQTFVPSLEHTCPAPSDELPATVENIVYYGDACIDLAERLPRCEFFVGTFSSDHSQQCRAFIGSVISYNGCVERHQWRPSFNTENWRIFLGSPQEVWRNTRDVIRLLDAQGRTVDVWSY